jgi:cysteine desulfurase/selenocysteine lyase
MIDIPFDVMRVRSEFPILSQMNRDKPLVYLDNAATSQKPICVLNAMQRYYESMNANVHRGVYELSEKASIAYENVRKNIQRHLNASSENEIIFVRGATEAINLVAHSFAEALFETGDEIIISSVEHHANIVPWQLVAQKKGLILKIIPMKNEGELDIEYFEKMLTNKTRLVAISHLSNVLGVVNPIEDIIRIAKLKNVPVLVDGAQAKAHMMVDVQALDCDFYVYSAHKFYGPTGIGVLFGKTQWLNQMVPYQGGGDMITSVTYTSSTFQPPPLRFEAGTPAIAEVIGMGAAHTFFESFDTHSLSTYEKNLTKYIEEQLVLVPGLRIIAPGIEKHCVVSFVMENIHPHDIASIADSAGVAIRAGHHCAMPLMHTLKLTATARVSVAMYNTKNEIDILIEALHDARKLFQ